MPCQDWQIGDYLNVKYHRLSAYRAHAVDAISLLILPISPGHDIYDYEGNGPLLMAR